MTKFSANLGFLWADRPLPDAILAAHRAGFDAVEMHWPYDVPVAQVQAALAQTGLPVLGLNTVRGNPGENGLSALPGREIEARAAIDQAVTYAVAIGAQNIHVMAGFAQGPEAHATFVDNLKYACTQAGPNGIGILIEPLNPYDAPGYFLNSTGLAQHIINDVGSDTLRLMFDCYHVQLIEGDLSNRIKALLPIIGHVQFASVPDRGAPDHGEIAYGHIFDVIESLGWETPLGAEYKPGGDTDATLNWLTQK